jgi:type IV pilus assembly protein PilQ
VDNKEAKIQSGRKIPYATSNLQGTSIQFVDATIELTVTPHITADQTVLMKIQAKKNAADFSQTAAGGTPTITTKEAYTEVLVLNGETTVLGGLYENTAQENEKRVPGLWSLPIIGYLFKNQSTLDSVTEMLIFITPTIVKSF